MKTRFFFHILFMTAVVFLASCVKEGPAGIAGADGKDGIDGVDGANGQDGTVTCLACHAGAAISSRQFQYAASVHKAGVNVAYAGGRSGCAECHSSEGFIEYQTNGSVASNISMPSAINCNTCHKLHTTFAWADFGLRASAPVALKIGGTLDMGDASNLCINCHQARTKEPNTASPGTTFRITSTHYGPHHGPQANLFNGIGFAEIVGPVAYPTTSKHKEQTSCVVCHMGDYVEKQGGHTWNPSLASCNSCHPTTNFDYGGVQFDTEEKLVELRDLLVAVGVVEYIAADDAFEPIPGTYPMLLAQAYYNWIGIEEDRSLGVHNPQYINALLTNTIAVLKPIYPNTYDLTKLNAVEVSSSPIVDGVVDNLWADVPALEVALGETNNPPNNPSQIGNCGACHSYNSSISVTVKTVYNGDNIYFLTEWNDPTASFTRGNSWVWDGTVWNRNAHTEQSEDRISFFWPIGDIKGSPYSTGGCMTKCHMYYPTDNDPHVSSHGIVDDAWLTSGRADMWHSKAGRGTALTSASGSNLTIDPNTFEVTAGTFTQIGYADDKYVDAWANDATNGEDGGRYGDAGTSAYSHNRIGDKSRPKWMEKNPTDYADAMTLTQAEIDAGECVGDATNGVSDADAITYWPNYTALTAIVPERILRQTDGSRADLLFGAVWSNGKWTAEIARKLNTGYDDDIQFTDFSKEYLFNIAEFDNSRHGYEHRTSKSYYLKFIK